MSRKLLGLAAIIVMLYAVFGQKRPAPLPPQNVNQLITNPAPNNQALLDVFQNMNAYVAASDVVEGSGPAVLCGQKVAIKYKIAPAGEEKAITFTVGDGSVIKGIDISVQGMKKGGKRSLQIPPALGFTPGKGSPISALVEIVDYAPPFENKGLGLKIYDDVNGHGPELTCGESGFVNYKIWDMDGNLLASTIVDESGEQKSGGTPSDKGFQEPVSAPIKITAGAGKYPYALELALSGDGTKKGLRTSGKRTLIAPSSFSKTTSGQPVDPRLLNGVMLPDKTLLFEVELVGAAK